MALERRVEELEVYGDSTLVIYQLSGDWETKDAKLIPYHKYIKELAEQLNKIKFYHLPRDENQLADALATLAAMFQVDKVVEIEIIKLDLRMSPAHYMSIKEEPEGKPWYHDVMQYLKHGEYQDDATVNDKKFIRRLSMNFLLDGEVLYKRSHDQILLRCIDSREARDIMEEVHGGICGTHANGYRLAKQIMRFGYYWLTLEGDYITFTWKCYKCQIYTD